MVVDHFEGPEKKLELTFAMKGTLMQMGTDTTWQPILDFAACTILSETRSSTVEAYLLSESSLFVFDKKIMIKTCGTTKLLHCLPEFIKLAKKIDPKATIQSLSFSRKNYIQPHLQPEPHADFEMETEYLRKYVPGEATVLGPCHPSTEEDDHWCVYLSDSKNDALKHDQCLELMMLDLDPEVMNQFHQKSEKKRSDRAARLHYLGADHFDDHMFFPCGYSVNAVKESDYFTVHITPNEGHSYVSYETNAQVEQFGPLANEVVATYRPGRFCIALKRGEFSLSRKEEWADVQFPGYERTEIVPLEHDIHHVLFLNFTKK
eukprot:CAMPEP_0201475864 /NCGR_PEP_ID=MMETSP0151_2-20130828/1198_1 /ASSEMBLY_ACC=CAM_ASM_000257 /TAXON_ID=200890 /ORGANISM="Paramoeba atlantica, Strain 621/1 / CCAP 1560/9" /LENGTH=318 /DNA_ID=CAMNT_0047856071 /DNA_START=114 /DNA_END=1071 /DNA_ORIENTATION=+